MNIIAIVNTLINMIPFVAEINAANILVPAVAAVVGFILAFYGKRLLNWIKLIVCIGGGYYIGSVLVWPYIAGYVSGYGITNIIVGIVLAVVFLVLGKYAYAIVFAGGLGYGAYLLFGLFSNPDAAPETVRVIIHAIEFNPAIMEKLTSNALLIAIGIGVIALVFRGLCETILTSVVGGAAVAVGLYTAVVNLAGFALPQGTIELTALLVVTILVCLGGYLKQVKNRHRF